MINKKDINKILISMKAGEKTILFIVLSSDGMINRIGDGTLESEDSAMYAGLTSERLLEKLMEIIPEDITPYVGVYKSNDIKGSQCELSIMFGTNKEEVESKFNYGSESSGPPREISEIVKASVNLTENWWQKQREMVKGK